MMNREAAFLWFRQFPGELVGFLGLLRERGLRHYQRPLAVAAAPLAVMYFLVYKGSAERLDRVRAEILTLSGVVHFAPKYRDLQERLQAFFGSLPRPKDKDRGHWLTETVREAMKSESVFSISLSQATEETRGGFAIVSLRVTCRLTYKQLASWIARLERLRYPVHVTKMVLRKDPKDLGLNDIDMTLSTVFLREEGGS